MLIETSGGRVYVDVKEGKTPAVVFIHGIPTNSYLWRNLKVSNKSIFVDLLGYGKSDKPEADLSVKAQAEYLLEVMEILQISEFFCVGHDIGGAVAQIMSVESESVIGMLLIDSAGLDYWPVPQIARLKNPKWNEYIMKVDLVKGFMESLKHGTVKKHRITKELAEIYASPFNSKDGKMAYLRAARSLDYRDTLKITEDLKKVKIPAVILWGEEDPYLPVFQGKRLSKVIGNSRFITVSNAGHFLPEDDPEIISMVINGMLK